MDVEEIFRRLLMFRKSWQIMKIELLSFCTIKEFRRIHPLFGG